jgi:hypothetical protein
MPRSATSPTRAGRRPTGRPARLRRWRPWLVLAAISIGWKVIVFTLGAAVPRWVISDGIAQLPVPLQGYGREARRTALALWNGPLERHGGLVRSVRVMSVSEAVPGSPTAAHTEFGLSPADTDAAGCGGRTAVVRAYTYFAIPYSEVRTVCDRGVVEYRVFRRRKAADADPAAGR